MGTGKTAVGKELAKKKKWRFVDLDELIELKEKRPIPEIFAKNGETYFRKIEKETLARISCKDSLVVSCGGGIVLDSDNVRVMKKSGAMVCLTASAEVILERTKVFKHRPLLNVPNPKERVEALLKERAPFYSQADIIVDTSYLDVEGVARKILESIPKNHE